MFSHGQEKKKKKKLKRNVCRNFQMSLPRLQDIITLITLNITTGKLDKYN